MRALVVAVVMAGCVAGCGGSETGPLTKAEYQGHIDRFALLVDEQCGSANRAEGARARRDELVAAADDLEGIEPPAGLEQANEDLIAYYRGYGDSLDALADKFDETGDPEEAETDEEAQQVVDAQMEVVAGYRIPETATDAFQRARQALEGAGLSLEGTPIAEDEYRRRVSELVDESGGLALDPADDLDGLREAMAQRGEALTAAAEELDAIMPPDDVSEAHDDLVGGLCRIGYQLESAARRVERDDAITLEQARSFVESLPLTEPSLQSAQEAFAETGFDLTIPGVEPR